MAYPLPSPIPAVSAQHLVKLHQEGKTRADIEGALQTLPVVSLQNELLILVTYNSLARFG